MATRTADLLTAAVLGLLALIVFRSAQAIPPSLLDPRFGADLLPSILAVALGGLAAALAVSAFVKQAGGGNTSSERKTRRQVAILGRGVLVAFLLAAYIAALDTGAVDFFLASIAFLLLAMLVFSGLSWRAVALATVNAVLTAALVQYLFTHIFSVFLP